MPIRTNLDSAFVRSLLSFTLREADLPKNAIIYNIPDISLSRDYRENQEKIRERMAQLSHLEEAQRQRAVVSCRKFQISYGLSKTHFNDLYREDFWNSDDKIYVTHLSRIVAQIHKKRSITAKKTGSSVFYEHLRIQPLLSFCLSLLSSTKKVILIITLSPILSPFTINWLREIGILKKDDK